MIILMIALIWSQRDFAIMLIAECTVMAVDAMVGLSSINVASHC